VLCSPLAAQAAGPEGALDARAWEMVSPLEKNSGEVQAPGVKGGGVFQAAAGGGALGFGSTSSFAEAQGAAPTSQYLATRGAGGWSTQNLTPPLYSGTYAAGAYQLFSTDLSRAILSNGWSCRGGEATCAAANPPLGPGAPSGYRNLYLREGSTYTPLITEANAPSLTVPAVDFQLSLAGAAPDLRHAVLSTCAALSADATEVPSGAGGCEAAEQNLYEYSEGTLRLINLLPGESQGTPGAILAAPAGAISADGSRVYFTRASNLYLREGTETKQVDEAQGGGASFQTASADGSLAFFTKAGHLYRYDASAETSEDLTPGGEVQGVLGASAEGTYLYYSTTQGLFLSHEGVTVSLAAGASAASPSDFPPASGTARVSPDGTRLAFLSTASLTGYANLGKAEVFLYEAPSKHLLCPSCNPRETTPAGPSTIPGAFAAGEGGPPTYRPRVLAEDGKRLFFTSADALLFNDTDARPDVYEWEASGKGSCQKLKGCLALISGGRAGEASFLDASATGSDAYFRTDASLLAADPGSFDIYDARAAGGFPEAAPQIPCEGDACQGPPPGPDDPTPGTASLEGPVNPPVRFPKAPCPGGKRRVVHHGKARCVPRHRRRPHRHPKHRRGGK
jgi:WD40-like Beta Propeller Repeat